MRLRTFGGLWIESSGAASDSGPRPRPLALLAILAVAGDKGLSRDRVLGVLWPETEEERARQSLSQAIYSVKRDLGLDVAASPQILRLDSARISSDVGDFRAAVAAKQWTSAAALYAGPFLDGFYLADAPEFERWAESERASLATLGIRAIEIAAKSAADAGHREEAIEHWHRLTQLDPANSRVAAAYIQALATSGDEAAAIAHVKAYADLLRREFDAEPDAAFEQFVARLREGEMTTPSLGAPTPILPAPAGASSTEHERRGVAPGGPRRSRPLRLSDIEAAAPRSESKPRRRTAIVAAIAVAAIAIAAFGLRSAIARRASARPILAVGRIRDLAAPDSAVIGAVLSEMLATSLGRLSDMQVVASSRMLELTPRDADTSRSALTDAARRAGATEIVEGELIPLANRQLRLEIRRVEIASGLVRSGYRVSGSDRIALLDSVTALIAGDFRLSAPATSLAEVTTRSPIAYRLYEEGLRTMYQADALTSYRLFQSAVREDSSFAMAVYYAWRMARTLGDADEWRLADRAVALASHAPPRERLLILTHVGAERSDLRAVAAAETLAANYPRDPEALVHAAQVMNDQRRAVALLDRAVALDSAAGPASSSLCQVCEALSQLTLRYQWADSNAAVLRTVRRWQTLRPNDATPWALLSDWLTGFGRRAEAEAATRRYEMLGGTRAAVHLGDLVRDLRLDDYDHANRECQDGLASPDVADFLRYGWYCGIGLRAQGRYREALALTRDGRIPRSNLVRRGLTPDTYQMAILDMETGRGLAAADEFLTIYGPIADSRATESIAAEPSNATDGLRARYLTWLLTLSATAAVAGGDTLRARQLVDSIERVGQRSLYARDPLLHHFVRGLLHSRGGRHDAAVQELRAAMHSPTFGYTRINYELGRSLLALNRPAEAIPVVQAALHGGLEGSCLYITRTELHELLAQLFDANHQRDSAAAHYAVVARAWSSADPFLASRYRAARAYLVQPGRR